LGPDERARITEIQDLLIERFVEQRGTEQLEEVRAKELKVEFNELQREMAT
jgi:hypothetical protein